MAAKVKKNAHLWARDPDDWYPEPKWTSEVLFKREAFSGRIVDPFAGTGRIVEAAKAVGYDATAWDRVVREQFPNVYPNTYERTLKQYADSRCALVTNPPFNIAEQFIATALMLGYSQVACFLQLKFLTSDERTRWMEQTPLATVAMLTPRPSCPPGAVILAGEKPGGGTEDYAWFIWRQGHKGAPAVKWFRKEG